MNLQGSCLCGRVQYQISGECSNMLSCHCSLCRKSHGSAFATFTSVQKNDLEFTAGVEHIASYSVSDHLARTWCNVCGSTLPFLEGEHYSVPAGTLHEPCALTIVGHLFAASKAPWYTITDDLRQFETFPSSMARPETSNPATINDSANEKSGSCLCGICQFKVVGTPRFMMNCHCDRCRLSRAAAHATNLIFSEEALVWLSGYEQCTHFKLPEADRFRTTFCHRCGSLMPSLWGEIWNVPAGCIDYDPKIQPKGHIFVGEKASWFNICDEIPQFVTRRPSPPNS
jgi:hypothetical protein